MRRRLAKLVPSVILMLTLVLVASPAFAQRELSGQTDSGAYYKIMVPNGWVPADGLVIWNHGFSLSPIGPVNDLGPLANLQLSEGYAVAASSYSQIGWALFNTVTDNRQMVDVFEEEFGVPEHILLNGGSLGGIVTAQAIEIGGLGNVVGAMPICGALAGSAAWDGGFDLRLLYDYVCGDVQGAAIPGGQTGLSFPPDPNFDNNAMALAVNQCTGILAPPDLRTAEQAARLQMLLDLTGLPEEFILTDMGFVTFGLADLIFDPGKLGGGQALGNEHVDYGDAQANSNIQRVIADPQARAKLRANYTPTGNVGNVKIVSIHTDKDGLVIVEHESDYAEKVPPQNLTVGIVVEDEPTHCGFTEAETVAAWESLRGWVAGLPQPDAAALQNTCLAIEASGQAAGPCRIDPGFQIPPLSARIRPRDVCTPNATTLCLNDNRFRVQATWADRLGNGGPGKVANPRTDDSGLLYFFDDDNWEILVKVLDGCDINNHFWVFAAAATDLEYTLTVTDTVTGAVETYENPLGVASPAITDTDAFATCP